MKSKKRKPSDSQKSAARPDKLQQKPNEESKSCPHSRTLFHMPPLACKPKWAHKFVPSNNESVRFMLYTMELNENDPQSWSKAYSLFYEAQRKNVIHKDPVTQMWQGLKYNKASVPYRVKKLAYRAQHWGLIAKQAK